MFTEFWEIPTKIIILARSPNLRSLAKSMHFFLGLQEFATSLGEWRCIDFLRRSYDSETPMVSGNLWAWRTWSLDPPPLGEWTCIDFLRIYLCEVPQPFIRPTKDPSSLGEWKCVDLGKSSDSEIPMVSGNLWAWRTWGLDPPPLGEWELYRIPQENLWFWDSHAVRQSRAQRVQHLRSTPIRRARIV